MEQKYDLHKITAVGTTNYRSTNQRFGIKEKDRLAHMFCIGKTGVGKSTLLKSMAWQDMQNGNGFAFLDPHGDVITELLNSIPDYRKKDLIYFNPTNMVTPIAFNPLHAIHPQYHHLVASGLVSVFKKIWGDTSWGPRMEHILRFSILTLLEYPDATLLDIQPLLTDTLFRDTVLSYVKNEQTISFWQKEFLKYNPVLRGEAISPVLNKLGLLHASAPLRQIVGQKTTSFRMQQVLDGSKILLCNLSKGQIGEDACALLGSMLVTSIQLAAMYRAKQPEHLRKPFFLYLDEFQTFTTYSFVDMLSECRKFSLGIFMANQFLDQLDVRIRAAIFGNCGSIIAFRVGALDAELLSQEFYPAFSKEDFINLPRYSMYIKLMIDGATSPPFSATSLKLL